MELDDYPAWENIWALREFKKMTDEQIAEETGKTADFVAHAIQHYPAEMLRRGFRGAFVSKLFDD